MHEDLLAGHKGVCSGAGVVAANPIVYKHPIGWVSQPAMGTNPPTVLTSVALK